MALMIQLQQRQIWSDNVSADGGDGDKNYINDDKEDEDGDKNDDDDGKDGLLAAPSVVLRKYRQRSAIEGNLGGLFRTKMMIMMMIMMMMVVVMMMTIIITIWIRTIIIRISN